LDCTGAEKGTISLLLTSCSARVQLTGFFYWAKIDTVIKQKSRGMIFSLLPPKTISNKKLSAQKGKPFLKTFSRERFFAIKGANYLLPEKRGQK